MKTWKIEITDFQEIDIDTDADDIIVYDFDDGVIRVDYKALDSEEEWEFVRQFLFEICRARALLIKNKDGHEVHLCDMG